MDKSPCSSLLRPVRTRQRVVVSRHDDSGQDGGHDRIGRRLSFFVIVKETRCIADTFIDMTFPNRIFVVGFLQLGCRPCCELCHCSLRCVSIVPTMGTPRNGTWCILVYVIIHNYQVCQVEFVLGLRFARGWCRLHRGDRCSPGGENFS